MSGPARWTDDIQVNTASGDVTVGFCAGPVAVNTASGDVKLSAVAAGRIELATASGDVTVAVVPGIGVYLDLISNSGDIRSQLDAATPTSTRQHRTPQCSSVAAP